MISKWSNKNELKFKFANFALSYRMQNGYALTLSGGTDTLTMWNERKQESHFFNFRHHDYFTSLFISCRWFFFWREYSCYATAQQHRSITEQIGLCKREKERERTRTRQTVFRFIFVSHWLWRCVNCVQWAQFSWFHSEYRQNSRDVVAPDQKT